MQLAAQSALTENGLHVTNSNVNCGSSPNASALALQLNYPPCLTGSSDPNHGNFSYVEAALSETEPTYFARVLGINSVPLTARAEAVRVGNPNCVYALDRSGAAAITVLGLAALNTTCGVVDESNSPAAFACDLFAQTHVPSLRISGGVQHLLCQVNPAPQLNTPPPTPADPLSYLSPPALPSCGTSTGSPFHGSPNPVIVSGTAVFYPGSSYCGGINILPGSHVTFMPGTYVLQSGGLLGLQGGLSIDLASSVNGSGVTFYNLGPNGGITFPLTSVTFGTVNITAPTTGAYSGILFYQDPSNTSPAVILGSSSANTVVEGAYYFPTAVVTCAVAGPSRYNILVAKDIIFTVLTFSSASLATTSFANDYSSLSGGSPLAGSGAALAQ